MDKLDEDHKFTYESEQDPDITDTLANAKLAEDQVNRRYYGWGYGYGGRYGYGGYGGYGGYYNSWYNRPVDWWTKLAKDNGKEGMVYTGNKYLDGHNQYGGYKDYDRLAAEYVRDQNARAAAEAKKKMSAKDQEAAKELPGEKEEDAGDDDKKKEGGEEKKEEDEGDKSAAQKEKKEDFVPPELKKSAAQKEPKEKEEKSMAQKKADEATDDPDLSEINIGGEKIVVGALGVENVQLDHDLISHDIVEYLQTGAEPGDSIIENSMIQVESLNNQEKMERLFRFGI